MEQKHRQHPVKILGYTKKNFWLLSIPLLRGLVALQFDFYAWVEGAWLDILIVSLILVFALSRWFFTSYSFHDDTINVSSGVFFRSKSSVPFSNIASLSVEKSFLLKPFRACAIYVDTNSGSRSKADISLTVSKKRLAELSLMYSQFTAASTMKYSHYPSRAHLMFFSLIFSNTLSGVILLATLIYQSGQLVGNELQSRVVSTLNNMTKKIALVLPKTAFVLSVVLLCGWAFSFVLNLIRHWNFSATRQSDSIAINNGFMTNRSYFLSLKKVNYVDFRQRLLSIIFRISSVHIHCTGYGKKKREMAVLIPITTKNEVFGSMSMLLPDFPKPETQIRPTFGQISRFIWDPIMCILAIPIVALTLMLFFPNWVEVIVLASIIFEIPLVWLLIVKLTAKFATGIGYTNKVYTLKYCKFYEYHTILLPEDKISSVKILRNPFQRLSDNCNLVIYTNAEHTMTHCIKYLTYSEVVDFLSEKGIDMAEDE